MVWALSVSLAATQEIDVSFSSCSYLDVSVHYVYRLLAMNSLVKQLTTKLVRFPHSEISGSKRTYSSPKHIVVCHVLLQLLVPRHPPCALTNLTTNLLIFHIRLMSFSTIHLINIVDLC